MGIISLTDCKYKYNLNTESRFIRKKYSKVSLMSYKISLFFFKYFIKLLKKK